MERGESNWPQEAQRAQEWGEELTLAKTLRTQRWGLGIDSRKDAKDAKMAKQSGAGR